MGKNKKKPMRVATRKRRSPLEYLDALQDKVELHEDVGRIAKSIRPNKKRRRRIAKKEKPMRVVYGRPVYPMSGVPEWAKHPDGCNTVEERLQSIEERLDRIEMRIERRGQRHARK